MYTVDIVKPGSLKAIIGPVATLKRIVKNRDFFLQQGYDVHLYTDDLINPVQDDMPRVSRNTVDTSIVARIKSFIKMSTRYSRLMSRLFIYRKYRSTGNLVRYYINQNRTPDIIQFHSDMECYYYLRHRKEHHAKIIMFLHSDGIPFKMELEYYPRLKNSRYLRSLQRKFEWTINQVDQCVFIAKVGQTNFLNIYPQFSIEKTTFFHNGIDDLTPEQITEVESIKRNFSSPYKYRMCCTGTINSRKGHRIIIDALSKLLPNQRECIHVDFIGDGPERIGLQDLVKERGLEDNISFVGAVRNEEIYRYLAQQNIYILMSKNEGLPISIIEAMRSGLPVISTNIAGIPEIVITGENGIVIEPEVEPLVSVLSNLENYDWEQMGKLSRARFEKDLTFDRMKRDFCHLYNKVLSR